MVVHVSSLKRRIINSNRLFLDDGEYSEKKTCQVPLPPDECGAQRHAATRPTLNPRCRWLKFSPGPGNIIFTSQALKLYIVIDLGKRAWKSAYFESSLFIIHEC